MSGFWAIFWKDFRMFFKTPSYYVTAFAMLIILAGIFTLSFVKFNETLQQGACMGMFGGGGTEQMNIHLSVFRSHLYLFNLLMIFLAPALMMRLLAEEKKTRTFDLLLTAPVASWHIVISKFLAGFCAVMALGLMALFYPAVTGFYAKFSWALLFAAFGGIMLAMSVYEAIGLFTSGLSESPMLAYILGVILNLTIWFIAAGASFVGNATLRAVFEHMSVPEHLGSLITGNFKSSSIVFFLSLVALFCFMAERVVESARWR